MDKSYKSCLQGLYTSLINDGCVQYPDLAISLERDLSRLLRYLDGHGTRFLTIDMPAYGKHFDKCLSVGQLAQSKLFGFGSEKNGGVIPRLFGGIHRLIFQDNGELRPDLDTTAVSYLRQLLYAAKKVRMNCDDTYLFEEVRAFFEVEGAVRSPTYEWDSDSLSITQPVSFADGLVNDTHCSGTMESDSPTLFRWDIESIGSGSERLPKLVKDLQHVADRITSSFGPIDQSDLRPRHGPGAVADKVSGADKYYFRYWPAKLNGTFNFSDFGVANFGFVEEISPREFVNHEPPSRLIAVPKTQKGPRLIAAEPTAHQWMQQALLGLLERKIKTSHIGIKRKQYPLRECISLRDQTRSGALALESSRTGSHATIDLSSASDRLSCWTVERMFRSNLDFLKAFHAVRTRWLVNSIDKASPKHIVLKKFAAQGSALTFPVQTICYAIAAISSVISHSGWVVNSDTIGRAARMVRIYGDDIIVPTGVAQDTIEILTYLGLKVNNSKTFQTGKFRESCGVDAYDGVEVTPSYFLEPYRESRPGSIASVVDCSNNFLKKGFWHTAAWLKSTIPWKISKLIPVVRVGSGTFGWESFSGVDLGYLRKRFNPNLHREEVRVLAIKVKQDILPIRGSSALLQYFTEEPSPDYYYKSGSRQRPRTILGARWETLDLFMA